MIKRMNLKVVITVFLASCFFKAHAQSNVFENFKNISAIAKPDAEKWKQLQGNFGFSIVNVNTRATYNTYPIIDKQTAIQLNAWAGEEVNAQVVISSKVDAGKINVTTGGLVSANGNKINNAIQIGYIYYVIADNSVGICYKQGKKYPDIIVPDIIDFNSSESFVKSYTNRPVWIKIKVPEDAQPGDYKSKVTASVNGVSKTLNINLKVSANKLPALKDRKFFLELWQYPVTEADYYKVKPWSDEHLKLMKPAMTQLKDAGEDVITASFFWDMFNTTARDVDDMFIKIRKKVSGDYTYDFTNFDKWVNYMTSIGISRQITMFGMATLNYRMYYYDEAKGGVTYIQQGVKNEQYKQFWTPYLKAFGAHLKEKGWFDKTTIGFSEKELDISVPLIRFIKSIDPQWKISYSGKYFPEIQDAVYDYSIISNQHIPADIIAGREKKGYVTTFYTSCWERVPNTFVMSDPIDATWLAWNASNRNLDGYLRYAFDFWTPSILTNVITNVASGDNFLFYPYGYSSVRFEMLKDGIEDFEKVRIKKNQSSTQIKSVLDQFELKKVNLVPSRFRQIQEARTSLE